MVRPCARTRRRDLSLSKVDIACPVFARSPWNDEFRLGIGYAVQDTLLKAMVAGMLPEGRRNLAFGLFYTGYGGGWLVGSVTSGLLYDRSLAAVSVFAV